MKVAELRTKLAKLKKEEIIKLAVEFYKLVPKAKKEDYNLDELVNNPSVNTTKKTTAVAAPHTEEMEDEIATFIKNAKEQYYLYPNRIISKKERATWRFKVKKWYKALTHFNGNNSKLIKQEKLLIDLYELMCESCGRQYFTSDDAFQSIGIEQRVFYKTVLTFIEMAEGQAYIIDKGVGLIVNNYLDRNTLYSSLMMIFIEFLSTSALKHQAIQRTEQLLVQNNYKPSRTNRNYKSEDYNKSRKNNNLAELGCRIYIDLEAFDEAIAFFKKHYFYVEEEVELYVLISILFRYRLRTLVKREIESAIQSGIKPRETLLNLLKTINEGGELPQYMR